MSRASHGGLEVERYIGSCLISSTVRPNLQKTLALTKKNEQPLGQHNNNNNNLNSYSTNNYSPGTDQCQYGNWTVSPLVSMTSSPRRNNQRSSPLPCQQSQQQQQLQQQQLSIDQSQQQQHHLQSRSPLSRLAIHTQGAPLIVTGRFNNRGKIQNCGNTRSSGTNVNNYCNVNSSLGGMTMSISRCMPQRGQRPIETSRKFQQQQQQQLNTKTDCQISKADNTSITNIANIDSLSIASDESSNNSENSLPRIIKPRKRRKKDRKPTNTLTNETTKQDEQIITTSNSDQLNNVTSKSYGPVNYETRYDPSIHRLHRRPPVGRESYTKTQTSSSIQEIVDTRQRFAHRHVQVKVLDDNRNIVVDAPIRTMSLPKGYRNYHHHHHLVNNIGNRVNINNNNNTMHNNNNNNNNNNNVNGKNIPHYVEHYNSGCERTDVVDDPGSCQCRYCDPSGLIWDVDQHVYSPYLTPSPPHTDHDFSGVHYPHLPLFTSRSNLDPCHEQIEYFDVEDPLRIHHHHNHNHNPHYHQQQQQHPHHHRHQQQQQHQQQQHLSSGSSHQDRLESSGCALLRRSWSDPTSYFSDQISAPIRDVGVIGDRGQTDIPRGRSSWPGSTSSGITSLGTSLPGLASITNSTTPTQSLEVSTEIVTSLNGHRDIEIKFYSSSPNAVNTEQEKSSYLDDNEDFSDIWSYHESKLQQDFHTLLQAEE